MTARRTSPACAGAPAGQTGLTFLTAARTGSPDDGRWRAPSLLGAVAQLSVGVRSPTEKLALFREGAPMGRRQADLLDVRERRHPRRLLHRRARSEPQLPFPVRSPT